MGYVDGYQYDVFISYARADNSGGSDDDAGWIQHFVQTLNDRLRSEVSRNQDLSVYFDRIKVDKSKPFPDQLRQSARSSAVFVALLSKRYLTSDWCLKELKEYSTASPSPYIFVAALREIAPAMWPKETDGCTPFELWRRLGNSETTVPLAYPVPRPEDPDWKEYQNIIFDLASKIAAKLDAYPRAGHAVTTDVEGPRIFVGECVTSAMSERQQLVRALEQAGLTVLPQGRYPSEAERYWKCLEADVKSSTFQVFLLGAYDVDKEFDANRLSTLRAQWECCRRHRQSPIAWLQQDLSNHDCFKDYFTKFKMKQTRTEPIANLIDYVIQRSSSMPPPPMRHNILVSCYENDWTKVESVLAFLHARHVLHDSVRFTDRDRDQRLQEIRTKLTANGRTGFLIFSKSGSTQWVADQIELMKSLIESPMFRLVVVHLEPPPAPKAYGSTADQLEPMAFAEVLELAHMEQIFEEIAPCF